MKRKIVLLLTIIHPLIAFTQSLKVADRYFEEFSYMQAAKLYEEIVEQKGDTSQHILSRLGDAYYHNSLTEDAEKWYKKLLTTYGNEIDDAYRFKYAQVLRSNGNYEKSDSIFGVLINEKEGAEFLNTELKKASYKLSYEETRDKRISVRNLMINTEFSDFGGYLINGEAYFSSAQKTFKKKEKIYKWNNQPFLNIFKTKEIIEPLEDSETDTILKLDKYELFGAPVTSDYHESTPVFSKDGKTIYFTRNNAVGKRPRRNKGNISSLKIYKASMVNGYWIAVTELPFNSDAYSVGHPALSPDGKTMYFVSNMPGGYGGSDIYKVSIDEDGEFGVPENLGATINTAGREMFPFVGEDNTLYFSTNGRIGQGLLDIYQSKIAEDGSFDEPQNLGIPFNSPKDDFAFFIDEEGKKGFFSSNRPGGKGDDDIYSFFIYTDPPVCYQSVEGIITNAKTKESVADAHVKLLASSGAIVKEVLTNAEGKYTFDEVLCENNYTIQVSKFDHRSSKMALVLNDARDITNTKSLELTPLIVGDQIVINPIYFDYGKAEIREDAQYELENIVTVMNNHPNIVIKIESHSDSQGKDSYNKYLSDKRAKATRDFLLSRGIATSRVESAIGYGEERLLNKCRNGVKCSEEEHQMNRRSYFFIVKGGNSIKEEQAEVVKQVQQNIQTRKKKNVKRKSSFLQFIKRNFKNKNRRAEQEKCTKDSKCDENDGDARMRVRKRIIR